MGDAKNLIVKPIAATDARRIIKALHYSGKVVNNSQVHLGVFMGDKCGGAMSLGPSLDKRKLQGLVEGTGWNEFIELNRMAFADWLPRNGESRCIGYAMRWLHKTYPWLKWVVSFADATQCGDGTIYRASGFVLTSIKVNTQIWVAPTKGANIVHGMSARRGYTELGGLNLISHSASMRPGIGAIGNAARTGGGSSMKAYIDAGFKPLTGFQLRYIYFLDPTSRERLTVPILPFSEIAAKGAGMYKGQLRAQSIENDAPADQAGQGRCDSDLCAPDMT